MQCLGILTWLTILTASCSSSRSTVVIPRRRNDEPAGLIFIPGASINGNAYIPLGSRIQDDSPYSLYTYFAADWLGGMVNPLQLPKVLEGAVAELRSVGVPSNASIFIAAHSLAGVFVDEYIRENNSINASGILLYASYISKKSTHKSYPIPVLTLSGDQDGMCRVTRVAKDFSEIYNDGKPNKTEQLRSPVIVLHGMNHSEFTSGSVPALVREYDIVADLTYKQAYEKISVVSNAFMVLNGQLKSNVTEAKKATNELVDQYTNTLELIVPYIGAVLLDHVNSGASSNIATLMQLQVAGLGVDNTLKGKLIVLGKEMSRTQFTLAKPTATKNVNGSVTLTVPFHLDMPLNPIDLSLIKQSPNQIEVKMFSQQKIKELFPGTEIGNATSCGHWNQVDLLMSQVLLPYEVLERFSKDGSALVTKADYRYNNVLEWDLASIQWTNMKNTTQVVSPEYMSGDYQYCKAMTLSSAMEWGYIDGLKQN